MSWDSAALRVAAVRPCLCRNSGRRNGARWSDFPLRDLTTARFRRFRQFDLLVAKKPRSRLVADRQRRRLAALGIAAGGFAFFHMENSAAPTRAPLMPAMNDDCR